MKILTKTYLCGKITPPCIITLRGDLGAGKTAFTKLFAKALGITQIVTSPTFTLMNEYDEGKFPLYHFDMYRIENSEEIYELGFRELGFDVRIEYLILKCNKK